MTSHWPSWARGPVWGTEVPEPAPAPCRVPGLTCVCSVADHPLLGAHWGPEKGRADRNPQPWVAYSFHLPSHLPKAVILSYPVQPDFRCLHSAGQPQISSFSPFPLFQGSRLSRKEPIWGDSSQLIHSFSGQALRPGSDRVPGHRQQLQKQQWLTIQTSGSSRSILSPSS